MTTIPTTNPEPASERVCGEGLVAANASARVDVVRAVTGLRHIDPSTEPALVFTHFAAVCVPAVCDSVVIDMVEDGHGYRIVQPAQHGPVRPTVPPSGVPTTGTDGPVFGSGSVTLTVPSAPDPVAGQPFTGVLTFRWQDGYQPTGADGALLALMVQHATILVHRARSQADLNDQRAAGALQRKLSRNRVLASAVGTVMALHHVDQSHAMEVLTRISNRSGRDLHDVADRIGRTGSLPRQPEHSAG